MSQQVAPQIDVGAGMIQGLAAISPMLTALSADNVAPMAMLQMENLSAMFHINGEYAKKIPDLLQRYSSVRLDRLGLAIGWRKGDAASYLAQSAGGQAIALLSLYSINLLSLKNVGEMLFELSTRPLPRHVSISSVVQLTDAAKIASSKVEALGFGNELTRQVMRIHDVYAQIGKKAPVGLLDDLTMESMCDLFYSLSQLREDGVVIHITGTSGMALVLGIVITMFPHDVIATVESLIIREGLRKSIWIEIGNVIGEQTEIHIERTVGNDFTRNFLRLDVYSRSPIMSHGLLQQRLQFGWKGWVASYLQMKLDELGFMCHRTLLEACCNLLATLPDAFNSLKPRGRPHTRLYLQRIWNATIKKNTPNL